jgi:hypothetical protein
MMPDSFDDIIQISRELYDAIAYCLSVTEDNVELSDVLLLLSCSICSIAEHMDEQYILHPDHIQLLFSALESCEATIAKLRKRLKPEKPLKSLFEKVKHAIYDLLGVEKQTKKLRDSVDILVDIKNK